MKNLQAKVAVKWRRSLPWLSSNKDTGFHNILPMTHAPFPDFKLDLSANSKDMGRTMPPSPTFRFPMGSSLSPDHICLEFLSDLSGGSVLPRACSSWSILIWLNTWFILSLRWERQFVLIEPVSPQSHSEQFTGSQGRWERRVL